MTETAARPAAAARAELTEEDIRAWSRHSRAARGLGPKITDPATLARIVTLALAPAPERNGKGGGNGPP